MITGFMPSYAFVPIGLVPHTPLTVVYDWKDDQMKVQKERLQRRKKALGGKKLNNILRDQGVGDFKWSLGAVDSTKKIQTIAKKSKAVSATNFKVGNRETNDEMRAKMSRTGKTKDQILGKKGQSKKKSPPWAGMFGKKEKEEIAKPEKDSRYDNVWNKW